jgi:hypothetical protein
MSLMKSVPEIVAEHKKTGHTLMRCNPLISLVKNGRRGGIRTRDPLHPMQVRYQAALHADKLSIIA